MIFVEIIITPAPPNISLLDAAAVRTLPGYRVTFPVTGSPPIHTAIIRNSTVLVNTTNTAGIQIYKEGNYTCVATSSYGTDVKEFTAIFSGKRNVLVMILYVVNRVNKYKE